MMLTNTRRYGDTGTNIGKDGDKRLEVLGERIQSRGSSDRRRHRDTQLWEMKVDICDMERGLSVTYGTG
jgi:hypothetical protein